jgi:hypothetical protein
MRTATMKAASTSTPKLRLLNFKPDAASVPTIKLRYDATGNAWVEIPVPIDIDTANELRIMAEDGLITIEEGPMPDSDFRAVETAYIQAHRVELANRYRGEWIAVDGPQVVAHSTKLIDLMKRAREQGHPNPFVTAIPAEQYDMVAMSAR